MQGNNLVHLAVVRMINIEWGRDMILSYQEQTELRCRMDPFIWGVSIRMYNMESVLLVQLENDTALVPMNKSTPSMVVLICVLFSGIARLYS